MLIESYMQLLMNVFCTFLKFQDQSFRIQKRLTDEFILYHWIPNKQAGWKIR